MKRIQKTMLHLGAIVMFASLFSGCASIVSKSTYPVSLASTPEGATATVRNGNGETVHTGMTPTTVTLKAGAGYFKGSNYTVEFEKPGYSRASAEIRRNLNGWYIGNVVFGGLIGFLIVDPLTGAMWRLDDRVHGQLTVLGAENEDGTPEVRILTLDDVPDELREHLVLIN